MSITDVLWIGHGAAFFPFLNCVELDKLRELSKECYIISKKAAKFVKFYGLTLPKQYGIFYDLFNKRYLSLQIRLDNNEDFTIKNMYRKIDNEFDIIDGDFNDDKIVTMPHGCIKYNTQWNGLVLMEIAYMLCDTYAIALLELSNRTTHHMVRSFSSTYNFASIHLTEQYSEYTIKEKLIDLRPPYSR